MRPKIHFDLRYATRDMQLALNSPMQGFDAKRILSQIVSLQCLHYLTLSLVLPGLLAAFTLDRQALRFQGGPTSLSLILDWREIAGIPPLNQGSPWPWGAYTATKQDMQDLERMGLTTSNIDDMNGINKWWEWELYLQSDSLHWMKDHGAGIAWSGRRASVGAGGAHEGADLIVQGDNAPLQPPPRFSQAGWWPIFARDASRGWIIVFAWALTGLIDVFLLSILIRRPTHIFDHTLTLHFFHLLLTTLYTCRIPTNLFYWLVMLAHAGACVVWAEALSIKRELTTGWTSAQEESEMEQQGIDDEDEQSHMLPNSQAPKMEQRRQLTHVLFQGDDQDDEDMEAKGKGKRANGNGNGHENIEMKRLD